MIRLEQSVPGAIFFTPSTYNTIVGMHGILMIVAYDHHDQWTLWQFCSAHHDWCA